MSRSGRPRVHHLSWLEAAVVGLLQGVTELFPVSSLGHSVLLPGRPRRELGPRPGRVGPGVAVPGVHRRDARGHGPRPADLLPARLGPARRRVCSPASGTVGSPAPDERLIWQLIVGTIPVGLVGLLFEHWLRTHLGRPVPAACFLIVNGLILLAIEWWAARSPDDGDDPGRDPGRPGRRRRGRRRPAVPDVLRAGRSAIGSVQILALAPGHLPLGRGHGGRDARPVCAARTPCASPSCWPRR